MHRTVIATLGALAVLGAPSAAQEAVTTGEILTLEAALAMALEDSAAVASAELQVQRAEQDLAASRTRRRPSFDLQAQATHLLTPVSFTIPAGSLGTFPATGPIPSADAVIESGNEPSGRVSATVAQPLTQLYKAGLGVKARALTRDMERQQVRVQRAAVAHEVRRLYYALLQALSAADAAREQAKALRQMDEEVGRYVAVEAALPHEGMDVKARLAAEEYRVLSLDNGAATYKEQLNLLFGRDPRTPFEVARVREASLEEVDLEAARRRALERRPELERARLQVELADTDRRAKKAELIPDVSLAVTYDSFFNIDLLPRNLAQVGVQLKWEPFDWGRRSRELAAKSLAVDQARYAARDQRHQVLVEVDRAFRRVQEARALVAARRMGHEGAQERMRVVMLRGREQAALLREVLQAQASAADARALYDEARLSLWLARAELDKASGEDR
jgi:outer membrane protein